ncbi:MAG: hypothetical protein PHY47_27170 [Lachnospiraceae bacterium]|nr:hypothetical protein [Lachnospiraceae bacterium]
MADEIAQVVEMEYKGAYYLFKGTKATIAMFAKAVKALMDHHHTKYLNKEGNCDWKKMQEISKGTPPILEFPKEMFEEKIIQTNRDGSVVKKSDFDLYCEKYGLRYCIMPDLNPNDDYIPVAVPTQDVGIHKEQIKAVMERRIITEEDKDRVLDEKIVAAKERIANATTEEEKKEAEEELTMLLDAKVQNQNLLKESKEKAEHDNEIDFAEYLKQGEGTLFETDPEKALHQDEVCGIVREYTPYDCMWPVRDEDHIPESGELFYSQTTSDEKIHMIKREFKRDEHENIYSEYRIRMPGSSEVKVYSDYGMSKDQWKKQIPQMLKEAGLENEVKTAVVQSEDRFKKYQEYVEANFKNAPSESEEQKEEKPYSSEESKKFVKEHNKELKDKKDYEESLYSTVTVPVAKLMPDGEEVMCMELSEGLVKGVMIQDMDEKTAKVFIKDDATYSVVKPDGTAKEMLGSDITKAVNDSVKEAITRTAGRGRK